MYNPRFKRKFSSFNIENLQNDNDNVRKKRKIITDQNLKYYMTKPFPNFHEFGTPDFIDTHKRQFRIAYNTDSIFNIDDKKKKEAIYEDNCYKLYIKIPKGSEWLNAGDNELTLYRKEDILLESPITLKINKIYKKTKSKTGYIFVSGKDVKKLLIQ